MASTSRSKHPERLTRLFAFAANSDPSGVKDVGKSPVFQSFQQRASQEYVRLSPTPTQFNAFEANIEQMWASQPHFTDEQLSHIKVPTWIVDGDHDEAIKRENTDHMAALIPGAGELILPEVSHFAFIQDPAMFNSAALHFLALGNDAQPAPQKWSLTRSRPVTSSTLSVDCGLLRDLRGYLKNTLLTLMRPLRASSLVE